jgi:hypothetical protein
VQRYRRRPVLADMTGLVGDGDLAAMREGREPGLPSFRSTLASRAVVSSPRSALGATFALKSAEWWFCLPVILVRLSLEQSGLNPLSESPGPPQWTLSVRVPRPGSRWIVCR